MNEELKQSLQEVRELVQNQQKTITDLSTTLKETQKELDFMDRFSDFTLCTLSFALVVLWFSLQHYVWVGIFTVSGIYYGYQWIKKVIRYFKNNKK